MSCFILDQKNYSYLKEKCMKLLFNRENSHIKYNLTDLKKDKNFTDEAVINLIDKKINYYQAKNIESVVNRYNDPEDLLGHNPGVMPEKELYYSKMTEKEILQFSKIIDCMKYQIEKEDTDFTFINEIQRHLLIELAYLESEKYDDLEWGF